MQLREEVEKLLKQAEQTDTQEDEQFGKNKRGDELPEELQFKQSRLKKIEEAMAALEAEAQANAEAEREAQRKKEEELKRENKKRRGRKPKDPDDTPKPGAQRNFTDPDSRIMPASTHKGSFDQAYNCQAAVDDQAQIIVATNVTQQSNDKQQVKPVIEKLKENMGGKVPAELSADSGYFSEANVEYLTSEEGKAGEKIDPYIATGKQKHGERQLEFSDDEPLPPDASVQEKMDYKLRTVKGRASYKKRKEIVEPVFGQLKQARGFRQFLLRGIENVTSEWDLICLTHNLLKLYRFGSLEQAA